MGYLGIDVGSSYLKIWHEDDSGELIFSSCTHHKGSPRDALIRELSGMAACPESLCYSGNILGEGLAHWQTDGLLAEVNYLKEIYPCEGLLVMGAEKIELVHFDADGRILDYRTNPACAAGTGSFLDEQMSRLGIRLSELANIAVDERAPAVATRCAVFAKTDLIHLQQEGHSSHALYNGLCKGLVISGMKSIFGGNIPDGSGILLTGGLLANPHISHYIHAVMPKATIVDKPIFSRARGLCASARTGSLAKDGFMDRIMSLPLHIFQDNGGRPLALEKSSFPSRDMARSRDAEGNEVWHDIGRGESFDAYLGVDVGSTSTKAVLVEDATGAIRLDIYTRTSGNPIEATRRIFKGITSLQKVNEFRVNVRGCCSTGSGRKLVGIIIGADLIINEISAHAKGAKSVDENVETIFEIGGQDSKFIRLDRGRIVDVNMNYVCAAGTGSFIEEQANTLDMGLDTIGEAALGVCPPANSDRCTVFMNQEITRQLSTGYSKESIMAGVLHAVIKNYLNRVVGNRSYRSEKIVFQGATARNRGLVASLEQITGSEVMVSPFCHVMGAYGAALLVRDRNLPSTTFRGFEIPETEVKETTCRRCENTCRITVATTGNETISWGYLCGREQGSRAKARRANPAMKLRQDLLAKYNERHEAQERVVRVPALGLYDEFIPLFTEMGRELNVPIEVCYPAKDETIGELSLLGSGDFCYPIKVAIACTNITARKFPSDPVLLPFIIQEEKDREIKPRSLYCPFITSLPSLYKHCPDSARISTPILDLNAKPSKQSGWIKEFLDKAGFPGITRSRIEKAYKKGIEKLYEYRRELTDRGRFLLEGIPRNRPVIVLLGRPYNLYHKILNLGIPDLIESLGYSVIPMDIIPDEVDNAEIMEHFPDLFWHSGQRILRKALTIKNKPAMFPLMLSNFSCGPDSFILSYFEEISRNKPYLILELDEHGSATGYQTRIEAFCDMIEQYRRDAVEPRSTRRGLIRHELKDLKDNARIWISQIHPYIPQLWSAVLRHHGYDAIPTGEVTPDECSLGRSFCRGSECLPAAVTIGKFISSIPKNGDGFGKTLELLFMPRAEGPCRFGQYATLQSRILERAGMDHAGVFSSVTSEDGYSFLTPAMELQIWRATCLGDMLFKLRCRTVPYHPNPQEAKGLFDDAVSEICLRLFSGRDWKDIVSSLVSELGRSLGSTRPFKPLVGVVGEIFVRMNTFSNQNVIEKIEAGGGEAWLSPMTEWLYYVWEDVARKSGFVGSMKTSIKSRFLHMIEKSIGALFSPLLDEREEPPLRQVISRGEYFVPMEFEGEAILTIGRAKMFAEQGAALVVNCSPFCCMPGRITSYLFQKHPEYFKVPVVNLFFDGIGDVASQVAIYLKSITQDAAACSPL